jgi:hypothetical protein
VFLGANGCWEKKKKAEITPTPLPHSILLRTHHFRILVGSIFQDLSNYAHLFLGPNKKKKGKNHANTSPALNFAQNTSLLGLR